MYEHASLVGQQGTRIVRVAMHNGPQMLSIEEIMYEVNVRPRPGREPFVGQGT